MVSSGKYRRFLRNVESITPIALLSPLRALNKSKQLTPNIWLGVSIENLREINRSRILADIPARHFWSVEPLLEDLGYLWYRLEHDAIEWVIVGGESGSKARICRISWIKSVIQQCRSTNVPVFVKQLGSNVVCSNNYIDGVVETHHIPKFNNPKAGDPLEWEESLRIREFPK